MDNKVQRIALIREKLPAKIELFQFPQTPLSVIPHPAHTIGICDQIKVETLIELYNRTHIGNFIQLCHPNLETEVLRTAKILTDLPRFFMKPIEAILEGETQQEILRIEFNQGCDKNNVLADIGKYLNKIPSISRLWNKIDVIIDELFTNVFFHNSPEAKIGRSNLKHMTLGLGKTAELMVGYSTDLLVIGCKDPFGTFPVNVVLERVRSYFMYGLLRTINFQENEGAQIGFPRMIQLSDSSFIFLSPGKTTWIGFAISMHPRRSSGDSIFKNIHIVDLSTQSS